MGPAGAAPSLGPPTHPPELCRPLVVRGIVIFREVRPFVVDHLRILSKDLLACNGLVMHYKRTLLLQALLQIL